ncbi:MAG: hypothetical protein ACD_22C00257G0003 [uncultured bacterium]|uniref:ATPase n=1 Tax=candidate division WWE3 bacterium RBG_16_37_10 TaxID=1802610 RepID=A0A1F4UTD9_UNCKA|nr:MAG: hypothetical protein ACD_22C00257G0003 [uncultured bacterium]OGC48221.1 MAG: hypothetical protein A2W32_02485 [candidate division WWE3 bacterium RBG_16_37_10]
MIDRLLKEVVLKAQKPGFITVIYGARRVGKTYLLDQILSDFDKTRTLSLNGDTQEARDLLSNTSEIKLTQLIEKYEVLAVDEAQRIPNIGLALKIIIDKFPQKKVFVTGSSSLDLAQGLQETLTGRTVKYKLYPLSVKEVSVNVKDHELPYLLPNQLLYGGYPYAYQLATQKEKQDYLISITEDYLFMDLFNLEQIANKDTIKKLTTLLAFQIGNEVSLNELAQKLSVSVVTVSRYLDLLEKSFIIFKVGSFSSNLRTEVARSKKYYFYDTGIRNALINQFQPLDSRTDVGALWENFLVTERLKKLEYSRDTASCFFWRDYLKAEIDWIEKRSTGIQAYEFKLGVKSHAKTPKSFKDAYKTEATTVNRDNYLEFVL